MSWNLSAAEVVGLAVLWALLALAVWMYRSLLTMTDEDWPDEEDHEA